MHWNGLAATGGGSMIESDGRYRSTIPQSVEALNMVKSWLGTISPRGETTYSEEDCRQIFENGNARSDAELALRLRAR